MLPIIFNIGSVTFYTYGFLLAVGIFLESFIIWRRLRDAGLKEEKIIDFIILALLLGLIFSRLIFIIQNFSYFGWHLTRWVLFARYPGLSTLGWWFGMLLALWRFVKTEKWNFWRMADEITFGLFPFLILLQLGSFLDGSGFGRSTNMPWGIYFPGILLKRHPLSLFSAFFLFIIWFFLIKIERHWRIWEWYKSKENGFILLTASGLIFLTNLPLAFIREARVYLYWGQIALNFIALIFVFSLFYFRSGRTLKKNYDKQKETKNN
ncbi:MAG: prolipoprotein diacylglyceryl transferase [Candidatus Shapirobacteria bacterium]|nr:prolipoprotein diacylglyceryl transferase [Candidatus Shapirobacteria bacterium]